MAKPQKDRPDTDKDKKNRESLLETLESIVVAFVLAFIFRAFIVEAFVIPTGSMAPTLYGAHHEFTCKCCGYKYATGSESGRRGGMPPTWHCPNCFYPRQLEPGDGLYSGDRILVLKFLYDFQEPDRWDVIVFHNPNSPAENYIKRLIGLPGEKVELRRGDVTINGRIVQKTDKAQEALWMIVHDTRWPLCSFDWTPRWNGQGGWKTQAAGFRLEKPSGQVDWLNYEQRAPRTALKVRKEGDREIKEVREAAGPCNILDYYVYNLEQSVMAADIGHLDDYNSNGLFGLARNVCTDLCLRGKVKVETADTTVTIELSAYKDRFRFELPARGAGHPTRVFVNDTVVEEAPDGVLPVGRFAEVLAANVDHKLMLWVDGRRVAKALAKETTAEGDPIYEPAPATDDEREAIERVPGKAAQIRLGVGGGPATVEYLRLDRDVYYTSRNEQYDAAAPRGSPLYPGYATEGKPFQLHADEFFVLGDNSPNSLDARLWRIERSVVPRRNLVGKAFFVYWPAAGWRAGGYIPIAPDPTGWRFVH